MASLRASYKLERKTLEAELILIGSMTAAIDGIATVDSNATIVRTTNSSARVKPRGSVDGDNLQRGMAARRKVEG